MKIDILGVKIDKITKAEVLAKIKEFLSGVEQHYIVTVNPEFIVKAQQDAHFKDILNKADISVADGIGILWAARYQENKRTKEQKNIWNVIKTGLSLIFYPSYYKQVLPEQIKGADLVQEIAKIAQEQSYSIGFIIPANGLSKIDEIKSGFLQLYPNLKINGYIAEENNNYNQNNILFVALGFPDQEKWIYDNLPSFNNIKLAIGVGGALDFISGKAKRAPKIIRTSGLEWLWRLLINPKRFKRIWTATYQFTKLIMKND